MKMKKAAAAFLAVIVGGACLCGNAVPVVEEATYRDDGIMPLAASSVKVNYESKSEDKFDMVLKHPNYTSCPYVGGCACVAGANVLGFYDRYDENLIPDHTSGITFSGNYIYKMEDSSVLEVVKQLYSDMDTDSDGTTVTEFKNGLIKYCNRLGKSVSFTSCMKSNRFDYSAAKSYMKANQPVVLFCSAYNVADIYRYDNYDSINYYESSANHVMVGFGYRDITYTISSSDVLYQFVAVASGTSDKSMGYYNLNYNSNINDAYAVNIY